MHLLPQMNVMLISFKRCQSSCEEHDTSEYYKKILVIEGFEPLHDKETSLQVHRLNRSANYRMLWKKKFNVHLMPVKTQYTIYK